MDPSLSKAGSKRAGHTLYKDTEANPTYVLGALKEYNQDALASERVVILENIIGEISQILKSAGLAPNTWFTTIYSLNFSAPNSTEKYKGADLLEDLHSCSNKLSISGTSAIVGAFRDAVEITTGIKIISPAELVIDGRFKLPESVKPIRKPFEQNCEKLEELAEAIFSCHFNSNPFDLSYYIIQSTIYEFSDTGIAIEGSTILEALGVARWKENYPIYTEADVEREEIIQTKNYSPEDIVRDIRRNAASQLTRPKPTAEVTVETRLANIDSLDCSSLADLASAVIKDLMQSKPFLLDQDNIAHTVLIDNEGNRILLLSLLQNLAVARWKINNPNKPDKTKNDIITRKGYSLKEIIDEFKEHAKSSFTLLNIKGLNEFFSAPKVCFEKLNQRLPQITDYTKPHYVTLDLADGSVDLQLIQIGTNRFAWAIPNPSLISLAKHLGFTPRHKSFWQAENCVDIRHFIRLHEQEEELWRLVEMIARSKD